MPKGTPGRAPCSLDGCDAAHWAQGFCRAHYKRKIRSGELQPVPRLTEAERFWAKVNKAGPIPAYAPHLGPCWLWLGATNDHDYGQFRTGRRANYAHRWSYEAAVGPIPTGLDLDHLCRVTRCCNPAHLEPVTHRVNSMRGVGLAAVNARKTHCINGHPFDEENTRVNDRGHRRCRTCQKITNGARTAS